MAYSRKIRFLLLAAMALPLFAQRSSIPVRKARVNGQYRPHAADESLSDFVRPGIKAKIVSAAIAKDGTITARINITDPKGLPLDMAGVNTPGAVSMRLIAATIPAGQKQYVAYTTT